jgi:hypothetical protein
LPISLHSRLPKTLHCWLPTTDSYTAFLQRVLADESMPLVARVKLAHLFLSEAMNSDQAGKDPSRRAWQRVIYRLFDDYLNRQPENFDEVLMFFMQNDYRRKEGHIEWYPPAGRRLRRYILTNPTALERFTIHMLIQQANADLGYHAIQKWFIESIFTVTQFYRNMLETSSFGNPKAEKARNIILRHWDKYMENGKPFFLEPEERL